ncbi:MAG TPA: fumarylacetoacetase [Candidatus Krumholzibacteria bacterium]|nr:fumarylacetoacetase [Candidatus Krumholzibacteria bacterium]HPD72144.1 fumarylacetoacetase [Candidatus Krumholzibacteria bacterium]HRY40924.1 fumarylacetoacetase [Candidatus Krumholzibacteria bacterium]
MDSTGTPAAQSFLEVAADSHFSLQNLPWGVVARPGEEPRCAVRLGDWAIDLARLQASDLLAVAGLPNGVFERDALNDFMALPASVRRAVRARLGALLRRDAPQLRDDPALRRRVLLPLADVTVLAPVRIGDYTDFYSSRDHATNVGIMFRGRQNALMPNWLHLPVGYHGRASSIVPSGTAVRRPRGQLQPNAGEPPVFGPSRLLDFELEVGFFYGGPPTELGSTLSVDAADDRIFGLVLVNDWSARDVQAWEYQPLGPFTAKNFATSISPWVVPWEALQPFRREPPPQDPAPLPYLRGERNASFDIALEVALATPRQTAPHPVCRTNFRHLYWTMQQQLAHHTVTGCNVRPGDLMASGTISGPDRDSRGSLLELTWRGSEPIRLPSGEERRFLEDGDTVIMTGWSQGDGYRVGFGEVRGDVLPARPD